MSLADSIKIDDIASGKVQTEYIYAELDRLKLEVNVLRNDLSLLLKALATIPEDQNQQEYFTGLTKRVQTVRHDIKEYCAKYNRLLPIINLAQINLGQDPEGKVEPRTNGLPQKRG